MTKRNVLWESVTLFDLKIKILLLILNIAAIIFGVYHKNYTFIVGGTLFLLYFLWVFRKWKLVKCRENFKKRALGMNDIILFFVLIVIFRLIDIQILNSYKYRKIVEKQIAGTYIASGKRGKIFDNTGKELGYNTNIYNIFIDPQRVYKNEKAIEAIKEIIDTTTINKDKRKFLKEAKEEGLAGRRYKLFSKAVNEKTYEQILEIKKKYGLINDEIFIKKESRRRYYKKDLYKQIVGAVGFVGKNTYMTGTMGIEREYESYLRGKIVQKKSVFSKNRRVVLPTAKEELPLDLNGKDVYLTIDDDIQYILNDEMKKHYQETNSQEAYGMIMDPNTGRILATAVFSKHKDSYKNPLFQSQMEPGSIFKPIVISSALHNGYITQKSTFDVKDGKIQKYNHIIRESSKSTRGVLTLPMVLEKSSNVAMVMISDKFSDEVMESYLDNFGFYRKTDIDFPYEILPFNRRSKRWNGLTKNTISFGQGIVVTPIQMATAFSAIVNGGTLYRPYLVDKIVSENGDVIRRNLPKVVGHPIDERTSKIMREMLENVVEIGGGRQAKLSGYRIGGKTGTAQISAGKKGYIKDDVLTSFVGFFPADKPKYVGVIMFYKPQVSKQVRYGGLVAAPVFREVVKRVTMNKGIESNNIQKMNINKAKKDKKVNTPKNEVVVMPDLTGKSLRDVIALFKNSKVKITPVGIGVVYKQKPEAEEQLEGVKEIKIYLK